MTRGGARATRWIAALLWAGALVGCAADPRTPDSPASARTESGGPVTTEQSELLAVARFNNYRRHYVPLEVEMELDGQQITLHGIVDYRTHRATAGLVTGDTPPSRGLLQWNAGGVSLLPDADPEDYATPPQRGWETRPYNDSTPLDLALKATLAMGADRPENPLLLRQGGVRLLGSETIDGTPTTIMSGPDDAQSGVPSTTRYWVDDQGTLRQVTINIPGATKTTRIRFLGTEGTAFEINRTLRARGSGE